MNDYRFLSVKVGENSHPEFEKITSMLGDIKLKGDLVELAEELDPAGLLPGSYRFIDN